MPNLGILLSQACGRAVCYRALRCREFGLAVVIEPSNRLRSLTLALPTDAGAIKLTCRKCI